MVQFFPKLNSLGILAQDFPQLSSTNTVVKDKLIKENVTSLFLISAAFQSNGHGKVGRNFYSPKNKGAYFTIGIPTLQWEKWSIKSAQLTITAAVAAQEVLEQVFGKPISIKWVNDLYLNNRKVTGILAESAINRQNQFKGVAIGWGINLAEPNNWPSTIKNRAGSFLNSDITDSFRLSIIDEIAYRFINLLNENWYVVLNKYRQHQYLAHHELVFYDGSKQIRGKFDHIDHRGRLCLASKDGLKSFQSGTVRIAQQKNR